uniref:Uncharacterized protein n=1 Tax=Oryza nivara TaxID=4536 RepID=A0A0E0HZ76_ORYNI
MGQQQPSLRGGEQSSGWRGNLAVFSPAPTTNGGPSEVATKRENEEGMTAKLSVVISHDMVTE